MIIIVLWLEKPLEVLAVQEVIFLRSVF